MHPSISINTLLLTALLSFGVTAQAHAQQWTLIPQSYVGFDIESMVFPIIKGRFNQFQSSMTFNPKALDRASAEFTLQVNSLSLNKPALKKMILAEDLFYADKYATATFNSHEFIALGNHQYHIKGILTLRGVSKSVTLVTVLKPNSLNPHLLDVESHTVVRRSDFGMRKAWDGIGENVNIRLSGQWQEM